jgi:hypothetical protein
MYKRYVHKSLEWLLVEYDPFYGNRFEPMANWFDDYGCPIPDAFVHDTAEEVTL